MHHWCENQEIFSKCNIHWPMGPDGTYPLELRELADVSARPLVMSTFSDREKCPKHGEKGMSLPFSGSAKWNCQGNKSWLAPLSPLEGIGAANPESCQISRKFVRNSHHDFTNGDDRAECTLSMLVDGTNLGQVASFNTDSSGSNLVHFIYLS